MKIFYLLILFSVIDRCTMRFYVPSKENNEKEGGFNIGKEKQALENYLKTEEGARDQTV